MGLFYDLPVYRATYDILLELFRLVEKMPREHKFALGEKMKQECLEIILSIYLANAVVEKGDPLRKAMIHLLKVRLMLRICNDLRLLNLPHFVKMNEKVEDVSRQLSGWMKSVGK